MGGGRDDRPDDPNKLTPKRPKLVKKKKSTRPAVHNFECAIETQIEIAKLGRSGGHRRNAVFFGIHCFTYIIVFILW